MQLDGRPGAADRAGRAHGPAGASIVGAVRRRLLLLAIAVIALTTASTASAAPRWHTYRIETGGFSVGLPSSWIDVTRTATPAILKELARNPSLKAVAELAGRVEAIKLVAGDAAPSSQAFMDVGVDRVGAIGLDRLAAETARELKQTAHPVGGVKVAKLRLPAGPAYRLTFRFSRPAGLGGDGRVPARAPWGRVRHRLHDARVECPTLRRGVSPERAHLPLPRRGRPQPRRPHRRPGRARVPAGELRRRRQRDRRDHARPLRRDIPEREPPDEQAAGPLRASAAGSRRSRTRSSPTSRAGRSRRSARWQASPGPARPKRG